jgi:hypothetical protein
VKKHYAEKRDANGEFVALLPMDTAWYRSYVLYPVEDYPRALKKFRQRFRLPYHKFKETTELLKQCELFKRWMQPDTSGSPPSPIELMILGVLRYIGRGWTFDDVEEATAINEETHRQFLHIFIHWGSTTLFDMHVKMPRKKEQISENLHEMKLEWLE